MQQCAVGVHPAGCTFAYNASRVSPTHVGEVHRHTMCASLQAERHTFTDIAAKEGGRMVNRQTADKFDTVQGAHALQVCVQCSVRQVCRRNCSCGVP